MKYSQYLLLLSFLMFSTSSFTEEINAKSFLDDNEMFYLDKLEKLLDCLGRCRSKVDIRLMEKEVEGHDPQDIITYYESKEAKECYNKCYEEAD